MLAHATIDGDHVTLHNIRNFDYRSATDFTPAYYDRVFDLHVNAPMQKIFTDRLRPAGKNDAYGVEQAKEALVVAYGIVDNAMATKTWAMGDPFTMADCAAAPALNYANIAVPFGERFPHAAAYLARLKGRPSFARALMEAEAYLSLLPK